MGGLVGKLAFVGVAHQAGPHRRGRGISLAERRGEEAEAVLGRFVGQGVTQQLRASGEYVGEREGSVTGMAGRNTFGPAHHERNPVPAFPDVSLLAPIRSAGRVARRDESLPVRLNGVAVVGGEQDDRVVCDPGAVDRLDDLPGGPVGLHDEIRHRRDAALAAKSLRWNDGFMG